MTIASSLFDYTNISSKGLVSNVQYSLTPTIQSPPMIFNAFVNPSFPLFTKDVLQSNSAVFTGLTNRPKNGKVASVGLRKDGYRTPCLWLTLSPSGLSYTKIQFQQSFLLTLAAFLSAMIISRQIYEPE